MPQARQILATLCLCVVAPASMLSAQNVYWGDLHIHTAFSSDAVGDPAGMFEAARDEEGLDFIAITDHDISMDAAEWSETLQLAASYNQPGVFVAFPGIEWTAPNHLCVYFLRNDAQYCDNCNTMTKFYNFYGPQLAGHEAGGHVAHLVHVNAAGVPAPGLDDLLLPNIEIWNGRHWNFDQENAPYGALDHLSQGYRLGFIGTSDDHSYDGTGEHARRLGDSVTGCHAATLTRASILEALRNRRCFATDNLRTVVDINVESSVPMGGAAEVCSGGQYEVNLSVSGTQTPSLVEIILDGVAVASRSDCSTPSCDLSTALQAPTSFSNVYGRVQHSREATSCVSCKTWTSPIRIDASTAPTCLPEPTRAVSLAACIVLAGALRARRPRLR